MHRRLSLWLAMLFFVAVTSAHLTTTESKQVEAVITGKRSLRVQAKDTDDFEERGILATATLRLKLKPMSKEARPDVVFNKLGANNAEISNETLLEWFKYVLKYRVARGEINTFASRNIIFEELTQKFPDERIALLLVLMAKQPKLKNLAKELEPTMLRLLHRRGVDSEYFKAILGVKTEGCPTAELIEDSAYLLWKSYATLLSTSRL